MKDLENDPEFKMINNMYDSYFGRHWPEVPLRRWEYVAAIIYSKVLNKPGRCLDAGSGRSVFPKFLLKIGCNVDAIDINIINATIDGIDYWQQSMTDLKFKPETFDYVFAISSIEHINAGRFKIDRMPFDTGDTLAMGNLIEVLKPGGTLLLTTDFARQYYKPPGLWPSGSHRIYSISTLYQRLILPFIDQLKRPIILPQDKDYNWSEILNVEPRGYSYTEILIQLEKK